MTEMIMMPVAVTVYPDRARVSRKGAIKLEVGQQRLEIPDLSNDIDPESVRVSAAGTALARLSAIQVQRVYYKESASKDMRDLEKQIDTLQDEMSGLEARVASLKTLRSRLDEISGHSELFATSLAAVEMDIDTQLAIFDRMYQRASELDADLLDLEAQKRDLKSRLEQLKNQLNSLRGSWLRQGYTVFVDLEVEQAGDLSVMLNYVISNASWKPLYDMRLSEDDGDASLEVGYLGQITQKTGESWENVTLSLSTARPTLATTLPELEPWYIEPIVPMQMRDLTNESLGFARISEKGPQDAPMTLAAEVPAEHKVATMPDAKIDASGSALTYRIPVAATIPADGAPHKVNIVSFNLQPILDYIAAPRLVEAVYRRARVVNESPHTLLPGDVNLFAGDEFIGTTRLDLTATGGEIILYLGVDDRIKVEREMVRRDIDKRLIGGKRRLQYGYELRAENMLPRPVTLELHDQIPVPKHEDIKVRLDQAIRAPDDHSELNLLEWTVKLGGGQKTLIRYDFSVEHPPELTVHGLP